MSSVRTGSANSKRGGQSELWALRDTVLQLQEEVLLSRAELDKSTKQFDALINLVRKSWKGDLNASVQVARIVGVPPPEYQHQKSSRARPSRVSSAVDARNVDGFLSGEPFMCDDDETVGRDQENDRVSSYLRERHSYLDEQLALHDRQVNGVSSAKSSKQASRPLYRPSSGTRQPENKASVKSPADHPAATDNHKVGYSHSLRYAQFGLFDSDFSSPNDGADNDLVRLAAQRKINSAGVVSRRGERPLKYEAVRLMPSDQTAMKDAPVTRAVKPPRPVSNTTTKLSRPRHSSAKTNVRSNVAPPIDDFEEFYITAAGAADDDDDDDDDDNEGIGERREDGQQSQALGRKLTVTPDPSSDDERRRIQMDLEADKLRSRLAKPESVVKFDEDLGRMRAMESSFRQKTLQLQQQLGIAPEGMIY